MKWSKILNYFTIEELNYLVSWSNNYTYEKALAIVGRIYAEKLDENGNCIKKGKRDNSGNAETFHLQSVSNMSSSKEGKIVGLLHDIVEDHYIDLSDLLLLGFSPEIVSTINLLSRDKSVYPNYSDYITAIIESENFIAIETKLHDMLNNLCPKRIMYLPLKKQTKVLKKWCQEIRRLVYAYNNAKKLELVKKGDIIYDRY